MHQLERYRIADLLLNVGAFRLTRNGENIDLPKLSFDFLTALARRAPDLVTVDELLSTVWDGVIVNEETVAQRAKLLRDALAPGSGGALYVQTVRGRGYRLALPAKLLSDASDAAGPLPEPPAASLLGELRRRRIFQVAGGYTLIAWIVLQGADIVAPELQLPDWTVRLILVLLVAGLPVAIVLAWSFQITPDGVVRDPATAGNSHTGFIGLAALLVAMTATAAWWMITRGAQTPPSSDVPGVAVLPFKDLSPGGDQAYFSDGIHEELLSRLAESGAFRVPSRTSVDVYRDSAKNAREIAAELGVDAVLEGSVRHAGDRVRITVQLIDARADDHLWNQDYDRALSIENLFAIQRDVAGAIAEALAAALSPEQSLRLEQAPTENLAAYDAYLKGVHHARRYSPADLRLGLEYLERAVALDPDFASAWSALANTYWFAATGYGWLKPGEAVRLAREYGARALELDPTHPATISLIGDIAYWYDFDWRTGEREYRRALEHDPKHIGTRLGYAWLLSALNRHDEAIDQIQLCLSLEPRSPRIHLNAAWRYMNARQYERAIEHADLALSIDPSFPDARISRAYANIFAGRLDEALIDLEKVRYAEPLGYALARAGRTAEAREQLELLQSPPPDFPIQPIAVAIVLIGLGEFDQAFQWLERGVADHHRDVLLLDAWEVYDPLRSDPRFDDLLVRLNLRDG